MRDVMTIGIILSLSFVVPGLLNRFGVPSGAHTGVVTQSDDDDDPLDSDSKDD